MPMLDVDHLHWLSDRECWRRLEITDEDWAAFRGLLTAHRPLDGVRGGLHHFALVVYDEDNRLPVNIIPHQYIVDGEGRIVPDNMAGLTREERHDFDRIMRSGRYGPGDEARITDIRNKMSAAYKLPRGARAAIRTMLRDNPKRGSAAEAFVNASDPVERA
ncbi:MAG: hypothetical protein KF723_22775 [Rhizobiaceae bacterium]|nr:hypothetical protein [Rhizobiaceae bacterium]